MSTALRIVGGLTLLILTYVGCRVAIEVAVIAFDLDDGRAESFLAGWLYSALIAAPLVRVMWPD
jgi:hypothetical protein